MESIASKQESIKIAKYWLTGTITAPSEVQCKLKKLKEIQSQIEYLQNQKLDLLAEIIREAEAF